MVGGAGTRLWPLSRQNKPKQFHRLTSEYSLFQETILRLRGSIDSVEFASPVIIGASAYLDHIKEQLQEIRIEPAAIFLEPCPRSTTPVAALAARFLAETAPDAIAILLPSDHYIGQVENFRQAISEAIQSAQDGWITTFGIRPTHPETGFGYIRSGECVTSNIHKVAQFTEKPDTQTALAYLKDTTYTWNSGIFMFSATTMLSELKTHAPDILTHLTEAFRRATDHQGAKLLEETAFAKCENISLDFAIMEKTSQAAVYSPLSCSWSDVGTWQAVSDLGSDTLETGNFISIDNKNCFIKTDSDTFVSALGLENLLIIAHEGNVLILPKDRSQDVSQIVAALHQKGHLENL